MPDSAPQFEIVTEGEPSESCIRQLATLLLAVVDAEETPTNENGNDCRSTPANDNRRNHSTGAATVESQRQQNAEYHIDAQ